FFEYQYFVRVYINDIIIFSKTAEEHFEYFRIVLSIIDKYYIYIGADKSFIEYPLVKLLNYIIDRKGVNRINNRITTFK
ncbi:hypothetical protein GE21DRAFT_1222321, partial [Neurospora crassa]